MALVPFLGAASVWIPCVLYLGAVEQRWYVALALFLYGAAVVSSIDNVIKMYVLHGRSTMHPLFALLSVLGGVKVFGPIGDSGWPHGGCVHANPIRNTESRTGGARCQYDHARLRET